ncbi:N-acetylmannosamine kinase [Vibrio sp. 99-8-1]|uniref:N-acetylmannosamine kinase n=1 Tax=Vibrio sp. 99-8-1 TaxID=2607602 RepID=UPI001493798B|nr:N-acetylmannosamine kinase [Vibrio sp. 99-8-1]NOI65723.1 ROK family protein [Vibrio sp. 99-8-1]
MKTLAIDIGGTKIALGLIEHGELQQRKQIATPKAISADQFAKAIIDECQAWLPDVDRIGVSTTGLVTPEGITAINPDTLFFPAPFPLHNALSSLTGYPVDILNDAQAAAWFEFLQLDENVTNMAYITVSTGVGGGLVINKSLHKGTTNFAGHIGHMVIDHTGQECGCGQKGCVEAIASGTAINKRARQLLSPEITNPELFALSESDAQAKSIIQAGAIATLCCNLKASLDLDIIVLGGGVGLANGYLTRVQEEINNRPVPFRVNVMAANGSHDACLLGAAYQFEGQ